MAYTMNSKESCKNAKRHKKIKKRQRKTKEVIYLPSPRSAVIACLPKLASELS